MSLMLPAYGLYGFAYYWPSWVHLLVIALMVVAGSLTLKALAARSAGRSRVYGLSCGFVAGLGNLSLCVLGQAEARHVWQLGTVIAIYAVVAVCVIMSLFMLWSGDSDGFLWSRAFHTFLLVLFSSRPFWRLPGARCSGFRCPSWAWRSSSHCSVPSSWDATPPTRGAFARDSAPTSFMVTRPGPSRTVGTPG